MTREEFAEIWQQQHYPTMDLQDEVPFYYDIYQRICSVANDGSKKINEFYVIQNAEAIKVLWLGDFQRQRGF